MLPSQLLRGRKTHSSADRPQKTPTDTVRLSFLNMDATLEIKEQNPYIYWDFFSCTWCSVRLNRFKSITEKYKSYVPSLSRWSEDLYLSPWVFHVLSLPNPLPLQKSKQIGKMRGVGSGCAQVSLTSCRSPHCACATAALSLGNVSSPHLETSKHTTLSAWETPVCFYLKYLLDPLGLYLKLPSW